MMKKPQNWSDVKENDGLFQRLPAGGHPCVIKQAKLQTSRNGNEMLVLALDIASGEYAGYFAGQFDLRRQKNPDAKWPCVYYQLTGLDEGNENPQYQGRLKHVIRLIEESNQGFQFDWDEAKLAGKKVGGVFREEEYANSRGGISVGIRCDRLDKLEGIENAEVPARRAMDGQAPGSAPAPAAPPIHNDDLPF